MGAERTAVENMSRWTTLDRITSVEPGVSATAIRNVPNTLAIFDSHFPRFHVLPGVLILGSMGELAAHLLAEETGTRWRLAGAGQVGFCYFVGLGDQLEISAQLKDRSDDSATLSGAEGLPALPSRLYAITRYHPVPGTGQPSSRSVAQRLHGVVHGPVRAAARSML